MKNIRKALITAAVAAALTIAPAVEAKADTTNGSIYNGSSASILVTRERPPLYPIRVTPGHYSFDYVIGVNNVQCFNPLRNVRSQYGGVYVPGWHCMSHNGIFLSFTNA